MVVYIQFDPSYKNRFVNDYRGFSVDIDMNELVENLKIAITLRFSGLDPNNFILKFENKRIPENFKLNEIGARFGKILQPNDQLILIIAGNNACCCNIF